MALIESVTKLQTLIPALKASDAKFASDLIASFKKYGGLTPKQEPWIDRLIARAEAPKPAAAPVVNVGGFAGVVALFGTAKASGLKFPKIRLVLNGTTLVLSLNGPKSKAPGAVSISGEGVYPNRAYYGRVSPDGAFQPFKTSLPGLTELLAELASNPARVAKDHGKLTGNCCFCGKAIGEGKEVRSVLAGFGPDCAENYGLKAEWLAAAEKAEAKASVAIIPAAETLDIISAPKVQDKVITSVTATMSDGIPAAVVEAINEETAADETMQAIEAHVAAKQTIDFLVALEALETVCFICDTPATDVKMLHGHAVCPTCAKQLV